MANTSFEQRSCREALAFDKRHLLYVISYSGETL